MKKIEHTESDEVCKHRVYDRSTGLKENKAAIKACNGKMPKMLV